ncbi:MAG: hypothetical protein WA432_01295 [Candidatus Babeliaceae bacterium]
MQSNLSKNIFIILVFTLYISVNAQWEKSNPENCGVITVPVADMLVHPVEHYTKTLSAPDFFARMPLCSQKASEKPTPCARAHQALFNEIVRIVATKDDQVCVEISTLLYGIDEKTEQPLNTFWTLKQWVMPLNNLQTYDPELISIPPPQRTNNNSVIILTFPFHESKTNQIYSFGTRFVHIPAYDTQDTYGIMLWDYKNKKKIITHLPKKQSMPERIFTPTQTRKKFVHLLNTLIDQNPGIIPYAWGGSSFTHVYQNAPGTQDTVALDGKEIDIWQRLEKYSPHSGFDCSELIWRVANMCGIPYLYKTTFVAEKFLEKLGINELPQEGDLIWLEGHIQVISNLRKNELIEASGYPTGFGKVQRAPLAKIFRDISTYAQLIDAYQNKKKITRLMSNGNNYREYPHCAILKLPNSYNECEMHTTKGH